MVLADVEAFHALQGRGDAILGEWSEQGSRGVYHIRRRLTPEECALAGGLTMRDLRGTDDGRKVIAALFHEAPHLRQVAARIGEVV